MPHRFIPPYPQSVDPSPQIQQLHQLQQIRQMKTEIEFLKLKNERLLHKKSLDDKKLYKNRFNNRYVKPLRLAAPRHDHYDPPNESLSIDVPDHIISKVDLSSESNELKNSDRIVQTMIQCL